MFQHKPCRTSLQPVCDWLATKKQLQPVQPLCDQNRRMCIFFAGDHSAINQGLVGHRLLIIADKHWRLVGDQLVGDWLATDRSYVVINIQIFLGWFAIDWRLFVAWLETYEKLSVSWMPNIRFQKKKNRFVFSILENFAIFPKIKKNRLF